MPFFDRETLTAAASGLSVSAFGTAALEWLMRAPVSPYGPICGHGATEPHCAACYVAAAMVLGGLAAASMGAGRRAAAIRVTSKGRAGPPRKLRGGPGVANLGD